MRFSTTTISSFSNRNCRAKPSRQVRATGGNRASSASAITARSSFTCGRPTRATMPNSAIWARIALTSMVRCLTRSSRVRCSTKTLCCSSVLTETNRIVGRVTASQIAAASAASFLLRFT